MNVGEKPPNGQSRMEHPETQATLGTKH